MVEYFAELLALAGIIWRLAKIHSQIEQQERRIEALEALANEQVDAGGS